MRDSLPEIVEKGRHIDGTWASRRGDAWGRFSIRHPRTHKQFEILVGDGMGWDHVSVSCPSRKLPSWDEMCWIKRLFFEDHECVVQYHPPTLDYVNHGPVLHLWRPQDVEIPMPPIECV